jgi:hypothetical protein
MHIKPIEITKIVKVEDEHIDQVSNDSSSLDTTEYSTIHIQIPFEDIHQKFGVDMQTLHLEERFVLYKFIEETTLYSFKQVDN